MAVTWNKDIKNMLAIGVVPDMKERGYKLDDYDYVASDYDVLHRWMADGSMPPGVSKENIAFIEDWITNDAPEADFPKVQDILDRAIGGKAEIRAHGAFWRGKTRDEFVDHPPVFGVDLIAVGDGAGSGLVKALKGELPFGSDIGTGGASFRRMPAGFWWTDDDRAANVALFEQWEDGGFLKDTDTPVPAMTAFKDVVAILDAAVGGARVIVRGPHGAFWRDISRDDFVDLKLRIFGNDVQLLEVNNGAESNLVKALKGPFTVDGNRFRRMPAGGDPVSVGDIKTIQDWIDHGCPA